MLLNSRWQWIVLLFLIGGVFFKFQVDKLSSQSHLAESVSHRLHRGLKQNEDLLKYTGEIITQLTDKQLEEVIKASTNLSHKSLTTSYISWADSGGNVLISGKAGLLKKGQKTIRERSYFEAAKREPWVLKLSQPERSVFSSKYVFPSALGITNYKGDFLGYLILGLKLDELYAYVLPKKTTLGYDVFIFDLKSKKYLPRFNSDDETFFKVPGKNAYCFKVRDSGLEIHIYCNPYLIFWDWTLDNKGFLFFIILLCAGIIFLMMTIDRMKKKLALISNQKNIDSFDRIVEEVSKKITDLSKQNTILSKMASKKDKSKEIICQTMIERTSHQRDVFNRLKNNLSDLGVMIRTIREISPNEKFTHLLTKCQEFVDDFENIGILETVKQSFSLNAIVSESLMYYANEFNEERITVYKNLSDVIPICRRDPLILKQILIVILGTILDESYGLGKVEIKTDYSPEGLENFIIDICEKAVEGKTLYKYKTDFIEQLVKKSGYRLVIEVNQQTRRWSLSFKDGEYSKEKERKTSAVVDFPNRPDKT